MLHEKTTKLKVPLILFDMAWHACISNISINSIMLQMKKILICFSFMSEKSFEAAATKAEGGAGEGAATWEGAWERKAAYCQTC